MLLIFGRDMYILWCMVNDADKIEGKAGPMRGGLSKYANSELREREKMAWPSAAEQKHQKKPTRQLLKAMREVEDMKKNPSKYKGHTDIDELMRDLLA